MTRDKSIAVAVANSQAAINSLNNNVANADRSLERNSSVLSRKELIK